MNRLLHRCIEKLQVSHKARKKNEKQKNERKRKWK